MRLIGAILVVLGAWMVLAVPVALLMGRFLRMGTDSHTRTKVPPAERKSYRTAA